MGRAVLAQEPGDVGGHVGALGLAALLGRPVVEGQSEDLMVVQAPLDRSRDQPGQLPGAIPGYLLEPAG
jgi:hypothetical protein